MNAAGLFVRCLENEEVDIVFGLLGEVHIDRRDALLDSTIELALTRPEQGPEFLTDVHGGLAGRADVRLSTLAPGAFNRVRDIADANMDRAPRVAIGDCPLVCSGNTNNTHEPGRLECRS
jgi:acetolactate synthase-1/2/3 large subunit